LTPPGGFEPPRTD